jgi:hypothetical protein
LRTAAINPPSGCTTVSFTGTANVDFFTGNLTIGCGGPGCLADTDDNGLPNDQGACPTSDVSATVVLDGYRMGVDNVLDGEGCTVADRIDECAAGARNHLHKLRVTSRTQASARALEVYMRGPKLESG